MDMNCSTCQTTADTRKARKAHSIATGHDFYVPSAEGIARYEARVAEYEAAPEPTGYISPLTVLFNRRSAR